MPTTKKTTKKTVAKKKPQSPATKSTQRRLAATKQREAKRPAPVVPDPAEPTPRRRAHDVLHEDETQEMPEVSDSDKRKAIDEGMKELTGQDQIREVEHSMSSEELPDPTDDEDMDSESDSDEDSEGEE